MERTITRTVRRKQVVVDGLDHTKDVVTSQTYYLVGKGYLPLKYNVKKLTDMDRTRIFLNIDCIYVGRKTARNWLLCHALRKEHNANRDTKISIFFSK